MSLFKPTLQITIRFILNLRKIAITSNRINGLSPFSGRILVVFLLVNELGFFSNPYFYILPVTHVI